MKLHGNARTCPHSRLLMVTRVEEKGWTLVQAAEAAGVSVRTVSKWLACYRAEGEDGLLDGSSAPRSIPHRTPEERVQAIAALRRLRMTAAEIGECLAMPLSTVSAVLTRIGLGKRSRLEPPEPPNRYERKLPGELLHIERSSAGSACPATASTVIAGRAAAGSAGSSCTSASTTRPGSRTSKSWKTRRRPPRLASCAAPSRTSAPTGSGSNG